MMQAFSLFARSSPVVGLAWFFLLLALLEWSIREGLILQTIVATPTDAVATLFTLQKKIDLVGAFLLTFKVTAAAIFSAIAVAVPVGYFLYRRTDFGHAFMGWLSALFAAPVFLLYPLFMVIFGRGEVTLILMGFIPGVIPIIVLTRQGLVGVSPTLLKVGTSYNLTESQVFWKILVPAATPSIFTGIRLGLIYVLVNIVAVEYLIDFGGLGRVVSDRYFRFDIPGTYAGIIAIATVSVLFNWGIGRVERWIRRY